MEKESMAEKWDRIAKLALAENPDMPEEEGLEAMAKINGSTVMDVLIEEADRGIAAGRGYPIPFADD